MTPEERIEALEARIEAFQNDVAERLARLESTLSRLALKLPETLWQTLEENLRNLRSHEEKPPGE
jgi:ParB-like chromosome segregation protein Spo0J